MNREVILTAAEMRAAEERAIAAGISTWELMQRAGKGIADLIVDECSPDQPILVLCGPGNNGGDGYVVASALARAGRHVQVHATGEPRTADARRARELWDGPVGRLENGAPAPILVDALFGTGLARPLDDGTCAVLNRLASGGTIVVAVDLPSGVATDTGQLLSPVPHCAFTYALGALKPAHLLQPAARYMGRFRVIDIGIEAASDLRVIGKPRLHRAGPDDHKYTRGLVTVIAGEMPGAAALAALAAARSGAGYVQVAAAERLAGLPHAIVQRVGADLSSQLADTRIGAVVVGPGLDDPAPVKAALASGRPIALDAGALMQVRRLDVPAILTPHEGEFARRFPNLAGSKIERARAAARETGAVLLLKGADSVVAAPDGRAAISRTMPAQLATAGSGDVLAGLCGTMLAQLADPFEAAKAAVYLQREAALAFQGLSFIADDLPARLGVVVDHCQ